MRVLDKLSYKMGLNYWKVRTKAERTLMKVRLKKVYKYKPFYDSFSKTYRVFFKDRMDEEGCIEYVVSEYIKDGLYYPFDIAGIHDHEHTFSGVLDTIMRYNGIGFKIKAEDKVYYSEQELDMLYKYVNQLVTQRTYCKGKAKKR